VNEVFVVFEDDNSAISAEAFGATGTCRARQWHTQGTTERYEGTAETGDRCLQCYQRAVFCRATEHQNLITNKNVVINGLM
jgi:hypothetical protein